MRTVRTELRSGQVLWRVPNTEYVYLKKSVIFSDMIFGSKSKIMDHSKLTCPVCLKTFIFGTDDYRGIGQIEFRMWQTDFFMHKADCVNSRVERIHA